MSCTVSCVLKNLDPEAAQQLLVAKQIGDAQKSVLRIMNDLMSDARSNLPKQGRDPEKALIEARQLRQACIDRETITAKNWSRTYSALIERNLVEQDGVHIKLSALGIAALT